MSSISRRFGTVVVTGATSGIGEATARHLVGGADVLIVHGPEAPGATSELVRELRSRDGAEIHYVSSDFGRLDDVVEAARSIRILAADGIDLLINNAAVPGACRRVVTADGGERTLQVNALAPGLLTRLLIPSCADGARIVNVGSSVHRVERFRFDDIDLQHVYTPMAAYARAELAMVTWSSLLAAELAASPVTVVSLCPGLVETPLSVALVGIIGGAPAEGADRLVHAATSIIPSGSYLEHDRVVVPSPEVADPLNRKQLADLYWQRLRPYVARNRI